MKTKRVQVILAQRSTKDPFELIEKIIKDLPSRYHTINVNSTETKRITHGSHGNTEEIFRDLNLEIKISKATEDALTDANKENVPAVHVDRFKKRTGTLKEYIQKLSFESVKVVVTTIVKGIISAFM